MTPPERGRDGLRERVSIGDPRLPERFWAKVIPGHLGCWQWMGALTNGYGSFTVDKKRWPAHRMAYVALVAELGSGLVVDHLCRNRGCVNPAHLEAVTNKENILRGVSPGAINARKTHCPRGHELTPENVYINPARPASRNCRKCKRIVAAAWEAKQPGRTQARRERTQREREKALKVALVRELAADMVWDFEDHPVTRSAVRQWLTERADEMEARDE